MLLICPPVQSLLETTEHFQLPAVPTGEIGPFKCKVRLLHLAEGLDFGLAEVLAPSCNYIKYSCVEQRAMSGVPGRTDTVVVDMVGKCSVRRLNERLLLATR